ncbi:MAG: rRNA maturation RNase YbeY [Synechococcaceae cyanobacterium]|jgi:probable rRNA maturation factor
MSGAPALDLAFVLADDLPAGLQCHAGPLAAPAAAEAAWGTLLSRWLAELAAELPPALCSPAYSLGLQLCDDAAIAALNEAWRDRAGPTDVLAFAAQEEAPPLPATAGDDDGEPLELGDIVISLETAARQAEEHGHPLARELCFLASHGLLHLLGWDHPDEASLAAMLARQERLLGPGEPLLGPGESR